ncbi:hypothetical protein B9Z55_017411 [Caenorhabditis nigoni]|uniref:Uncharacterized protein n=1 Tax=Caenorhabditis nigoni TaxID=1611254 RepID=A0A2G5T905_9PELO|nr:hypothetical protein B9Z55_017411 [Caenorhabditis nigoni]
MSDNRCTLNIHINKNARNANISITKPGDSRTHQTLTPLNQTHEHIFDLLSSEKIIHNLEFHLKCDPDTLVKSVVQEVQKRRKNNSEFGLNIKSLEWKCETENSAQALHKILKVLRLECLSRLVVDVDRIGSVELMDLAQLIFFKMSASNTSNETPSIEIKASSNLDLTDWGKTCVGRVKESDLRKYIVVANKSKKLVWKLEKNRMSGKMVDVKDLVLVDRIFQ